MVKLFQTSKLTFHQTDIQNYSMFLNLWEIKFGKDSALLTEPAQPLKMPFKLMSTELGNLNYLSLELMACQPPPLLVMF